MATIVEVARRAGVSKSTVSRVLNGVPVSAAARMRVETGSLYGSWESRGDGRSSG